MENLSFLVSAAIIVCGLVALVIYVLCVSLRQMSTQLTKMNELLLLAWSTGTKDEKASRVLLARALQEGKPPQKSTKPLKGVAEKPKKSGFTMTVGSM